MTVIPPLTAIFRAFDAGGAVLPGALLYTYAAGTVTPLATYRDANGLVPNTNPVVCDANGEAIVYLTAGVGYKLLLTDSIGNVQPNYPQDNVLGGIAGTNGTNGSTWRDGSGVPSNALGVDGDYYLNTANGDVYVRSSGVYGIRGNIQGPPGSSRNAIQNGTFYGGLAPWNVYAAAVNGVVPTYGGGRLHGSGAPNLKATSTIGLATAVGEVSQGFAIQTPAGTTNLQFYTAAWLEATPPLAAYSASIAVYFYDAQSDTETLIGTYPYAQSEITTTYATAVWTLRTIDVSDKVPTAGTYGIRCELTAISDNTGGSEGAHGILCGVDDFLMLVSSAGVTGPAGPAGPVGPMGPSGGGKLQSQVFTTNGTITVPAGVNFYDVTAIGAGGGGGAGEGLNTGAGGGGGGAGASIRRRVTVTPLSTYAVTIGVGGNGGTVGVAATDGTATTFGSLVSANGGIHGLVGGGVTSGIGGLGGAGATGTLVGTGVGQTTAFSAGLASALINGSGAALAGGNGGAGGIGGYCEVSTVAQFAGANGGYAESATGGAGGAYPDGIALHSPRYAGGSGGGGGASAFGNGGAGGKEATSGVSAGATAYGAGGGGGGGGATPGVGGSGANGYLIVEWIA
jgi:hypothetical protein